jgi:FdhD protein
MDLPTALRALHAGVTERPTERFGPRRPGVDDADRTDTLVVEEPLEIRLHDETIAVTMRTPGQDARLAVGYLYGEGIIRSLADLGGVTHCGRPGDEGYGNIIEVRAAPGVEFDIARVLDSRRFTVTTAACGVCGRQTIDDLLRRCTPIAAEAGVLSRAQVVGAVDRLRELQPNFSKTGGIHAAAIYDRACELVTVQEDIGRHNAVDKAVGDLLYRGLVGDGAAAAPPVLLVVSGRASFEIVQKAIAARLPVVASVSAVSSLAVDLAEAAGVTLIGFARGGSLNLYTHAARLS